MKIYIFILAALINAFFFNISFIIDAYGEGKSEESYLYEKNYLDNRKNIFIEQNGDLKIESILITGNKNTMRIVILNSIGIRKGNKLSEFDPYEAVNRLKSRGIFSYINLTYIKDDKGSLILGIHVKEKITLIPIPIYSDNGHSRKYGLFLLESNFLGLNKNLFLGGMYSTSSMSFMAGYTDRSFLNTDFNYKLFFKYAESEFEDGTVEEHILSKYKGTDKLFSLGTGYYITPYLNLKIVNGFRAMDVDPGYDENLNKPESGEAFFTGGKIEVIKMRYNEFLNFGIKARIEVLRNFFERTKGIENNENERYTSSKITAEYSHKIFHSHKVRLFLKGGTDSHAEIFRERIGGTEGFQSLPGDIITSQKFGGSKISYEIPFMKFSWGFATAMLFYEQGIYRDENDENITYHGPGAGFMIYLKRIAIPALGLNYARNMETGLYQSSVSVGFGF